ncbi:unnamed protein product, partial [Ixodes pacificus]
RHRPESRICGDSDKSAIDADSIHRPPGGRNVKERTLLDCGHPRRSNGSCDCTWDPGPTRLLWHRDLVIPEEHKASTTDDGNHSELNNG